MHAWATPRFLVRNSRPWGGLKKRDSWSVPRKVIQSHTLSNQGSWLSSTSTNHDPCAWHGLHGHPKSWLDQSLVWGGASSFAVKMVNIQARFLQTRPFSFGRCYPQRYFESRREGCKGFSILGSPRHSLHTQLVELVWYLPPPSSDSHAWVHSWWFGSWQIWKPLNFEGCP